MPKYVDAEALIDSCKVRYCEYCERRKYKKTGGKFGLYEIGDVPCKSCELMDMFDELDDFPAADVQKVKHGKWGKQRLVEDGFGGLLIEYICPLCKKYVPKGKYCLECGAKMDLNESEE